MSLCGLDVEHRRNIVLTAVLDLDGREHVVSRVGDLLWDFRAERSAPNRSQSARYRRWRHAPPSALLIDAQAALYLWFKRGRQGLRPPTASSVCTVISGTNETLQYMAARGVETFSDINPRLVKDYIESLRGIISPQALAHRLQVLELVWIFREDMLHPEAEHPWMERKLSTLLPEQNGSHLAGRRCTTPVIPPSVQAAMFDCAEAKVSGWKALLDRRDAGELSDFSYKVAGPRGAALYLVQISGGLRNSEAVGIKNGCLRRDKIGDEEVFWISTVEHKTSKGEVDYIVPGELLPVLELLQRFAAPYQAALRREIQCLQHLLGTAPSRNRERHIDAGDDGRRAEETGHPLDDERPAACAAPR